MDMRSLSLGFNCVLAALEDNEEFTVSGSRCFQFKKQLIKKNTTLSVRHVTAAEQTTAGRLQEDLAWK